MRLRDFGANSYSASCYVNTVSNEKQSIERNDCKDGWYQQAVRVKTSQTLCIKVTDQQQDPREVAGLSRDDNEQPLPRRPNHPGFRREDRR
jgi:hypothetical protein